MYFLQQFRKSHIQIRQQLARHIKCSFFTAIVVNRIYICYSSSCEPQYNAIDQNTHFTAIAVDLRYIFYSNWCKLKYIFYNNCCKLKYIFHSSCCKLKLHFSQHLLQTQNTFFTAIAANSKYIFHSNCCKLKIHFSQQLLQTQNTFFTTITVKKNILKFITIAVKMYF
jgi:hypothetical protein